MTKLAIDLLALVAVALMLRARPAVVLAVLLGAAVLVPGSLVVPHTHFSYFTVQHVLALATLWRLIDLRGTRTITTRDLRGGPALGALGLVIAVAFLVGIVLSIDPFWSVGYLARLSDLGNQVVFFVGCIVMVRRLDNPWRALQIAAGVLLASVTIAVGEHVTGKSLWHWIFSGLPDQSGSVAAAPLDVRNGQLRVRSGAEFALQFGWISACLLPAALLAVLRSKGRYAAAFGLAVIVSIAVYWSFARSALAGLGVLLIALGLLLRNRRVSLVLLLGVAAAGIAVAVHPGLVSHVNLGSDKGSLDIRLSRLDLVLNHLSAHPFRGLGLGNITHSGVATTDNAFLLAYTELGAAGVVTLALLLLTAFAQCVRAAVVATRDERPVAIACALGVVGYIASIQFYDGFSLVQGVLVLWFFVAVATVVAERGGRPVQWPHPPWQLVAAVAAVGVAGGFALAHLGPTRAGQPVLISVLPNAKEAALYDTYNGGKLLVGTACAEAEALARTGRDVEVQCQPSLFASGVARLQISAPTTADLRRAEGRLIRVIRGRGGIGYFTAWALDDVQVGRPSALVTAPLWLPLGLVGVLLFVPWRRRDPDQPAADATTTPLPVPVLT